MPHAIDQHFAPRLRHAGSPAGRGSLARQALRVATALGALVTAVALAYLVKSALRIDILPGPSPLHDIRYPIVERLR